MSVLWRSRHSLRYLRPALEAYFISVAPEWHCGVLYLATLTVPLSVDQTSFKMAWRGASTPGLC